jgi:UDP-4-amino-4,6-dideoxy-N-acetyl-beta-L-altrosamine transaminase
VNRTDLPYSRQSIEDDDVEAVVRALRSDYLTTGPEVERFERALAQAAGAPHALALCNGTAALHAACFAAGLAPGDEVIVPAVTFLATANCVRYLGAEPVFADVDPDSGLLLASEVERLRTSRTRAVIPVHLGGVPADLAAIRTAAGPACRVIEDATHALGATSGGEPVGACGHSDMAVFSFHPVKPITTGEGGAVTLRDPRLRERIADFRNHGMVREPARWREPAPGPWYYEQHELGYNLRLTDLQAALGRSQLGKLARFTERRRALAARYDRLLAGLEELRPAAPAAQRFASAYHLYVVLIDFERLGLRRAELMRVLREGGIGTQVHYIPLPLQPYYRERGASMAALPGARRYYERALSLPLFPAMQDGDVERVARALRAALGGGGD